MTLTTLVWSCEVCSLFTWWALFPLNFEVDIRRGSIFKRCFLNSPVGSFLISFHGFSHAKVRCLRTQRCGHLSHFCKWFRPQLGTNSFVFSDEFILRWCFFVYLLFRVFCIFNIISREHCIFYFLKVFYHWLYFLGHCRFDKAFVYVCFWVEIRFRSRQCPRILSFMFFPTGLYLIEFILVQKFEFLQTDWIFELAKDWLVHRSVVLLI